MHTIEFIKNATKTFNKTEALVNSTLAFSLFLLIFLKANNSLLSFTKALMTAIPEKLS